MTMQQNATLDIRSQTPHTLELERAAQWFTAKFDLRELADQAHTVTVLTGGKAAKCTGHFRDKKVETEDGKPNGKPTGNVLFPWYQNRDGTNVGVLEINLYGEHLNRPVVEIMETLFHELVHATASARGIKDCAESGRHNKKYFDLATTMGLDCIQDDKGGWSVTSLKPELLAAIETDLKPDNAAFTLAAAMFQPKAKTENKRNKYTCECETGIARKGAEFRSYQAVVLNGKCYDCKADFQKV